MLLLIPLFPLVGFLLNASFGRRLSKAAAGVIACGAMVLSFAVSVAAVVSLVALEPEGRDVVQRCSRGSHPGPTSRFPSRCASTRCLP
jgi:NADH-quinone oxidoreductase subunit L